MLPVVGSEASNVLNGLMQGLPNKGCQLEQSTPAAAEGSLLTFHFLVFSREGIQIWKFRQPEIALLCVFLLACWSDTSHSAQNFPLCQSGVSCDEAQGMSGYFMLPA